MFGLTERELVPVNAHPKVMTMREQLLTARADLLQWEVEEHRLKQILDPPPDSATYTHPPSTVQDIREARQRLKADLGVTVPTHFYLPERRAAQQGVEDLEVAAQQARDQAQRELVEAVKARVARLAKDFEAAFQPCQDLAQDLLTLQEESGVQFPQVHSCLPDSNVANELAAVKGFAKG